MSTSSIIFTDPTRRRFEELHRFLDVGFLVFVAAAPLALGGTHPIAAVALFAVLALLCGISLVLHGVYSISPRRAWPVMFFGALCAWVLFRSTVLGAWTNPPMAADAWTFWPELQARGGIAPGRAGLWVIRTLTFTLSAWYAAQRFMRSGELVQIPRAILAGVLMVVAVGVAQHLTHASAVLWSYAPIDWTRVVPLAGPFVNPNQAGAYVGLGAVLAAAGANYTRARNARLICAMLTLPLLGYVLWVGARGAVLATLLGVATLVFCILFENLPKRARTALSLSLVVILVGGTAAALYSDLPLDRLLKDASLIDKMNIWREARAVPLHGGVLGFGPRGFQDAFAALGLNTSHVWVEDPESGLLQLFSEHGVFIGLAVCLLVAWILIRLQWNGKARRPALSAALYAVAVFVLVETVTGMGLHASSYLIAVGAMFGIASSRILAGRRSTFGVRALAPVVLLTAISIVALAQSPRAIHVSLNDSRVPLASELQTLPIDDPKLIEEALRQARQTPGRAALIEQVGLIYSARQDNDHALRMSRALQKVAPNYAGTQRSALRIAIAAGDTENACRQFQIYRERFGGLPTQELITWHETSGIDPSCFRSPDEQLLVAQAFLKAKKTDLADGMIFDLASDSKAASTPALVEAVAATQRMDAPMLADPWVEELLTRDNLERAHFAALQRWSRTNNQAPVTFRIAAHARRAFPDDPEFRVTYLERFMDVEPDQRQVDWYAGLIADIESARPMTRGNRKLGQRLSLVAAHAAWQAEAWEDASGAYKGLENSPLPTSDKTLVYFRLGELARKENDYYHARRYYQRALETSSRYAPAQQALDAMGN